MKPRSNCPNCQPDLHKFSNGYVEPHHRKKSKNISTHEPFVPASIILTSENKLILTPENNFIKFTAGMIGGTSMSVDETGNNIIFNQAGSYRFEFISSDAIPISDVDITLKYNSPDFTDNIKCFTDINLINYKFDNAITILPIDRRQKVSITIVAQPAETVIIPANAKLIIYRVA